MKDWSTTTNTDSRNKFIPLNEYEWDTSEFVKLSEYNKREKKINKVIKSLEDIQKTVKELLKEMNKCNTY